MDGDFKNRHTSNLDNVSQRDVQTLDSDSTDDKRWFFEGALLLYRRREYASPVWSYRLRLANGKYERRSTGEKKLDDALRHASDRYQEVK